MNAPHIMGNDCGPACVAEYERQCGHDFIFSARVNEGMRLPSKGGVPRADQEGDPFAPLSPDPSCAAETTGGPPHATYPPACGAPAVTHRMERLDTLLGLLAIASVLLIARYVPLLAEALAAPGSAR